MSKILHNSVLPLGFAEHLLDLEVKLQEEQSLELVQILSQMYRIAVDYYINVDVKKAGYFQRKMNKLALKFLNAEKPKVKQQQMKLSGKVKQQINKLTASQKLYLKEQENHQKRYKNILQTDLNRQEETFKGRMLKRVKSTEKF